MLCQSCAQCHGTLPVLQGEDCEFQESIRLPTARPQFQPCSVGLRPHLAAVSELPPFARGRERKPRVCEKNQAAEKRRVLTPPITANDKGVSGCDGRSLTTVLDLLVEGDGEDCLGRRPRIVPAAIQI